MLSTLLISRQPGYEIHGLFRLPEKDQLPHPLPEDFDMRGLVYVEDYFPNGWFSNDKIDELGKYFELPSVSEEGECRILSLGYNFAFSGNWLLWNEETRQFEVPEKYNVKINLGNRQRTTPSNRTRPYELNVCSSGRALPCSHIGASSTLKTCS